MKKILLLICFIIFLTACGSSTPTNNTGSSELNSKEPESEKLDLEAEMEDKESKEKPKEEPKISEVKLDEAIIVDDFAEISIKTNKFGKRVDPPNPGSFYTYYENKETDQIYLDTVIAVKSLLTSGKSSDEFVSVKIIYDNKYEYTTFSTIEDNGGSDFTFTNITKIEPLQTGVLHFLASVPLEIEGDDKPLKAVITINGESYEQIIR